MEAKQYATKQPMGTEEIKDGILENTWKQIKSKTQRSKIYGMQQKQF